LAESTASREGLCAARRAGGSQEDLCGEASAPRRSLHLLILRSHGVPASIRSGGRSGCGAECDRFSHTRTRISGIRRDAPRARPGRFAAAAKSTRSGAGTVQKRLACHGELDEVVRLQSGSHWHLSCSRCVSNQHDWMFRHSVGFRMSACWARRIGWPCIICRAGFADPNFSRHKKHNHRQHEKAPKGSTGLPKESIEDKETGKYLKPSSRVMGRVGYYAYEPSLRGASLNG